MATLVNKTVGPGKDYATLTLLEAANRDCVANDEYWVVTCDDMEESLAALLSFAGWNLDATRYLHIKSANHHKRCGAYGGTVGYRITRSVNSAMMDVRENGTNALIIFEDLQFRNPNVGSSARAFTTTGITNNCTIRFINCIFEVEGGDAVFLSDAQGTCEFINCVFISRGTTSRHAVTVNDAAAHKFYHCIAVCEQNNGNAWKHFAGGSVLKNCYGRAGGGTGVAFDAGCTQTKCAAADATASDAALDNIAFTTANFTNVTAGTENFHLAGLSSLIMAGADLSGESAPFNVLQDIDYQTRSVVAKPDIGPDDNASSPLKGGPALLMGL